MGLDGVRIKKPDSVAVKGCSRKRVRFYSSKTDHAVFYTIILKSVVSKTAPTT